MPESPSTKVLCQSCGAVLDPTILGGTCSACMWSGIISGEQEEQASLAEAPEIEGYLIHEEIGHGGMGIVYRASQESTGRDVALKIVAPYSLRAAEAKQRFLVEAETMAAVEHAALLPLYDTGEDKNGRPWLTMQLAQGGTLAKRIAAYSQDWKKSARLLVTLCGAVYYAHERGILHRDLKPANILFDDKDNAYIADFGLAKWADDDSSLTRTTSLLGSPAYLAPEAAAGGSKDITTASDVYGLGAILYELLVGARPYDGEHASEVLTRILDKPPLAPRQLLPDIPRDLEVIVLKAMARDPEKRYHSAAAFADDLTRWLEGRAIMARPIAMPERIWNWTCRNPALSILSLLLLTSLIGGGILLWNANRKLTTALDDAEARVDFMTRELPTVLAPVGRLDLLETVFEDVATHYETNAQTNPESLARQADFLTNWSKIFLPRDQVEEALERLEPAMAKAEAATSGTHFPIEAARSRVSTGIHFAEALTRNKQLERARPILDRTTTFVDAQQSDDLRLQVLSILLFQQYIHLEKAHNNLTEAALHGEAALKKWEALIPRLETDIDSPKSQLALIEAAKSYHTLSRIYKRLEQYDQQDAVLARGQKISEKLMSSLPEKSLYHHQFHDSRVRSIAASEMSFEKKRILLLEADGETVRIARQHPDNIGWINLTVFTAVKISDCSWHLQDWDNYGHWLRIAADRQEPVYQTNTTNLDYLTVLVQTGEYLAERLEYDDWRRARLHFEACIQLQIRRCRLNPNANLRVELRRMITKITPLMEKHEGEELASEWTSKINSQIEKEF